jgi:hypothetical protein
LECRGGWQERDGGEAGGRQWAFSRTGASRERVDVRLADMRGYG